MANPQKTAKFHFYKRLFVIFRQFRRKSSCSYKQIQQMKLFFDKIKLDNLQIYSKIQMSSSTKLYTLLALSILLSLMQAQQNIDLKISTKNDPLLQQISPQPKAQIIPALDIDKKSQPNILQTKQTEKKEVLPLSTKTIETIETSKVVEAKPKATEVPKINTIEPKAEQKVAIKQQTKQIAHDDENMKIAQKAKGPENVPNKAASLPTIPQNKQNTQNKQKILKIAETVLNSVAPQIKITNNKEINLIQQTVVKKQTTNQIQTPHVSTTNEIKLPQKKDEDLSVLKSLKSGVKLDKQVLEQVIIQLKRSNRFLIVQKLIQSIKREVEAQKQQQVQKKIDEQNIKYAQALRKMTPYDAFNIKQNKLDQIIKLKIDQLKELNIKLDESKAKLAEPAKPVQSAQQSLSNFIMQIRSMNIQQICCLVLFLIVILIILMISFLKCLSSQPQNKEIPFQEYPSSLLPMQDEFE